MPKHLYVSDFTAEHYNTLLTRLEVKDSEEQFNDKKGAIRKALIRYFAQTHQAVDVDISFSHFSLKKHRFDPSYSETLDRIVHYNTVVFLNVLEQKEKFSPLPYLVSIPKEVRANIFDKYTLTGETAQTARTVTRKQINVIFDLSERDIVLFLRGGISVRYFTPPKQISNGAEKRFAGESPEEMEAMYRKYFPDGAWESIESVLDEVIEDRLDFTTITNAFFTKTFVPTFRAMVEVLLLDIVDENDRNKIEGLTGYVLRQHFHAILLHTAKNLLGWVENRNKNAEQFIKYFSDEIIIDGDGKKIRKFPIIDAKQQIWNYSSIVSVMMQYKQANIRLAAQEEVIVGSEAKVAECERGILSERETQKSIQDTITQIESKISENDGKTIQITSRLRNSTESGGRTEIDAINAEQGRLARDLKKAVSELELIKNRISNKTSECVRQKTKLTHEKKALQTLREQTESVFQMYETVAEALSLALSKR